MKRRNFIKGILGIVGGATAISREDNQLDVLRVKTEEKKTPAKISQGKPSSPGDKGKLVCSTSSAISFTKADILAACF